ncbi:MAG: efflux RND transporter periplasmic adaptor subunit, partial [Planctomycetes bacterium]|nr:efflux RND transporter periplasmic adaptor subunit [Planctomycetota bacterium]
MAPIEQRTVTPKQSFVGTVMPVRKAVIGSAVDGRIAEFRVNEGDYLDVESEEGGVLAVLLRETIGKEVEAAQAELRLRDEELKEMQQGFRPEEKEQARARMEAAKAAMEYSRLRLRRLESLFRQGRAASPEEVDEATAAANQAHNAYLEAVAAQELIEQGPRAEQKAQAAARRDMQQAVVDRLEDQFEKHTIRARFNGYVSAEHTELGAWVNRGDPVAEIVALDEVDIEVHVVENHVPFVHVGDATTITLT